MVMVEPPCELLVFYRSRHLKSSVLNRYYCADTHTWSPVDSVSNFPMAVASERDAYGPDQMLQRLLPLSSSLKSGLTKYGAILTP